MLQNGILIFSLFFDILLSPRGRSIAIPLLYIPTGRKPHPCRCFAAGLLTALVGMEVNETCDRVSQVVHISSVERTQTPPDVGLNFSRRM